MRERMKIVSIVGARPQFIKCAPLSKELRKSHEEVIVHTGQHYDYEMSKVFFDELEIPKPDYNLNAGSGAQGQQTAKILAATEEVLLKEKPQMVMVFGDTNSTVAGALAAAKLLIPIAHVEAGLRSYDRTMPEEVNRVLTDHISNLLFVPTEGAVEGLCREGIRKGVHRVGDVMVDSLSTVKKAALGRSTVLQKLGIERRGYFAMTMHRASNTDDPAKLSRLFRAVERSGIPVVFPIHPRTGKVLKDSGLLKEVPPNIKIIEPLGYLDMIALMASARGILTDSGGIQKEAFILGTRCITLRENTEWTETLTEGRNRLVGLDEKKIERSLSLPALTAGPRSQPFGRAGTSRRIAAVLDRWDERGRP